MTVHSYSLFTEFELMSLLQASLMHCEVLDRTWPIFLQDIKEELTGSSANAKTIGKYHLGKELNELFMWKKGDGGDRETERGMAG